MNKYYVYQHVDNDGTVMYTGMRSGCRVWNSFSRDPEHRQWMEERMPSNFNWKIVAEGLTQKEACAIEQALIKGTPSKFNKGYASGLRNGRTGQPSPRARTVINKTTGEIFNSIKEAADSINRDPNSVGNCCKGYCKSSGGFEWEYYESN